MTALFIVLGIIAFIAACLFFGGINHRIQRRRCDAMNHLADCAHDVAIFFGYFLWFIILPAVVAYELAVGRLGAPKRKRLSHADRVVAREQDKQRMIAERSRTLEAKKHELELQLDLARFNDFDKA